MAILNYTTQIDPWRTVNELQQIMAKHKITHFSIKNEGSVPVALAFTIDFKGRPLNFLLPCNYQGVLACLKKDRAVPDKYKNSEQALRISWRIIKNWIEAQLAIVQSELVTIEEVFMPYLIVNGQGETLSKKMLEGDGMKLLN
jgi:hypothetical protein